MTLGTRAEGFTDSPGRATQAARVQAAGRTVTSEWALNRPGTRQESLGWSNVGRQLCFQMWPLQLWSPQRLESSCTAPLPALHHGCLSTSCLHGDLIRT